MKTKNIVWMMSLMMGSWCAQSCSQDEEAQDVAQRGDVITLNASFEGQGSGTRTTMNDSYEVLWATGDQFALFATDGTSETFTLSTGVGTTSGTFTGTVGSDKTPVYAVFPYAQATSVSGTTLTMKLPSTISDYTGDSNGPMLAKGFYNAGAWSNLSFKHLAAMLNLTVNKFPAGATTLEITASSPIAGTFTANLGDALPELAYTGSDGSSKVTATFTAEQTSNTSKTFYFPIPTGTYTSITAKLTDGNTKTYFEKNLATTITLARRDILVVPAFDYIEVTGDTPTPSEVTSTISNAGLPESSPATEQTTTVSIPSAVQVTAGNQAIEVPVVENSNIALSFGEVPTGTSASQPLEIKETSGTTGNSQNNEISIAIPQVEEASAPSMTLNLTKSTVTLEATGETATYGTVVASTAANTLIVKEGVTVKELVIGKGNVVVYGIVEKISRSDDNPDAKTTITSYGKADIQAADASSLAYMTFESKWDGVSTVTIPAADATNTVNIYTAAQLASLQSGTTRQGVTSGANLTTTISSNISLLADVDLNNQLWYGMVLGENLTFNGNNHEIKNLSIAQSIMTDTNTSTKNQFACAGFFAAIKSGSVVDGIQLIGGGTKSGGTNSKWMGALIGHCLGSSVKNCGVQDVRIVGSGSDSYRVGGLIGFIGSGNPTIENCSVTNAYIEGYFSLGGLIGSVQCNSTYNNCQVSGISFKQKTTTKAYYGAISCFIGDPEMAGGTRTIDIDANCVSQPLTPAQKTALKFYQITKTENEKSYYYDDDNKWVGIIIDANLTLYVGGVTLTKGTDYSKYTESSSQSGPSLPGYDETEGEWE